MHTSPEKLTLQREMGIGSHAAACEPEFCNSLPRGNDDFLRENVELLLSDHHDVDFELTKVSVGVIQTDNPVSFGHHLCQSMGALHES
ncbi:hypothetical protein [Endozoicomonas sp. ALB032]|uniref:hypothetical protein n=1 Tax=Endozoicomonas sp. ALB032 TaxID=3403082 RepID=UPI003BB5E020